MGSRIKSVRARQIFSERGHPGIESTVTTEDGKAGTAVATAGVSIGKHEVQFAYDGGERWAGMGVQKAVDNVNAVIAPALKGLDATRQREVDEAMLKLDYRVGGSISAGLTLRVREDQLVYIRRTRTGDNKTAQTYLLQPFITKTLSRSMSLTQRYELSADYTFYTFDEDRNFLIRNLGITTEFRWSGLSSLDVTLSHRYVSQDEGAYVRGADGVARYGKSSERDDHTLGVTVKYKLFDEIRIEASQDFTVQQRWTVEDQERRLSWERHDARLTGKAAVDYELADGTTLKVSVARTDRDATNIVEQQRRVWDISVSIDKTF